jgi:hypothetical protein
MAVLRKYVYTGGEVVDGSVPFQPWLMGHFLKAVPERQADTELAVFTRCLASA